MYVSLTLLLMVWLLVGSLALVPLSWLFRATHHHRK